MTYVPFATADKSHIPQGTATTVGSPLPTGKQERKDTPLMTGVFDYFPAALAEVAKISKAGNDQHNPGQPMHHARGKSSDHADSALRHMVDRGKIDTDGQRHTAKAAWRILAELQQELEDAGAPLARAARLPPGPILKVSDIKLGDITFYAGLKPSRPPEPPPYDYWRRMTVY